MSTDATGPVVGSAQFTDVAVGRRMTVYRVQPTIRHAVMYAAAMWEFQRIHYDDRWAREEEGLPGAVVQGPVLGNYLVQSIQHWALRYRAAFE